MRAIHLANEEPIEKIKNRYTKSKFRIASYCHFDRDGKLIVSVTEDMEGGMIYFDCSSPLAVYEHIDEALRLSGLNDDVVLLLNLDSKPNNFPAREEYIESQEMFKDDPFGEINLWFGMDNPIVYIKPDKTGVLAKEFFEHKFLKHKVNATRPFFILSKEELDSLFSWMWKVGVVGTGGKKRRNMRHAYDFYGYSFNLQDNGNYHIKEVACGKN